MEFIKFSENISTHLLKWLTKRDININGNNIIFLHDEWSERRKRY